MMKRHHFALDTLCGSCLLLNINAGLKVQIQSPIFGQWHLRRCFCSGEVKENSTKENDAIPRPNHQLFKARLS